MGFDFSLGLEFKCWNRQVSLSVLFAALFDSAAVTAVLLSFLQVFSISGEHYLCENEEYDTAGWNCSVNGSLSDS